MAAEEITNITYDRIASSYAERYWAMSLDRTLQEFAEMVKPGGTVLDLGCGPGRDVALLNKRGFKAFGIDRSTGMLGEARRRVGTEFVCADMRRIPIASYSLDGVWMCASLLHIPRTNVLDVLNEVSRVLKQNGVLFVSVREGEGDEWSESDGGRRYFTLFQLGELLALVKEAQFKIVRHSLDAFGHSNWISILAILEPRL